MEQQMPQHRIEQARPQPAALASTPTTLVLQQDPVLLNLEEFLIKRDQLRPLQLPLLSQLPLGMSEHFFAMSKEINSHGQSGESPSGSGRQVVYRQFRRRTSLQSSRPVSILLRQLDREGVFRRRRTRRRFQLRRVCREVGQRVVNRLRI